MSFDKLLEGIHIKQELKIPFYKLIFIAFDQCNKLRLQHELKNFQLSITTDIDSSQNTESHEVGAHLNYFEVEKDWLVAEIAIPDKIDTLMKLYLFAHEIGHFINGHKDYLIQGKEKPSRDPFDLEVEADEWAVQFFYDMGIERSKEVEEAICNNLSIYSKPGEKRTVNFEIK